MIPKKLVTILLDLICLQILIALQCKYHKLIFLIKTNKITNNLTSSTNNQPLNKTPKTCNQLIKTKIIKTDFNKPRQFL